MGVTFAHLFLIAALSSSTVPESTSFELPELGDAHAVDSVDTAINKLGEMDRDARTESREPDSNDKLIELPVSQSAEVIATRLWDPDPVAIRRP